jgi:hypothetical protein
MPYRRTHRWLLILAILALAFSVAANIGTSIQAYQNCRSIELLKATTRSVLEESYDDLISGKRDADYKRIYGETWAAEKTEDIVRLDRQIHRFDKENCSFIIK